MKTLLPFIYLLIITPFILPAISTLPDIAKQQKILNNEKKAFDRIEEQKSNQILHFKVEKPILSVEEDKHCFITNEIEENTLTLLSKEEKDSVFFKYINKCNGMKGLKNLTNELTSLYIKKGFITSKVYLKPQDISSGLVKIHAIEGKISEFSNKDLEIQMAFFLQEKKNLNLRDLEIGIENLNSLSSNHAKLKLKPATSLGNTIIDIENKKTSPLNGYLMFNNYGEKNTGKYQGSGTLNIDNLVGFGDKFSIGFNSSNHHNKQEYSKGNSYAYTFALGRLRYAFSYSKSRYLQLIKASFNEYEAHGSSKNYDFDLNYKLFHNQNNKISLGFFLNAYKSKNYIDEAAIETSTYNLSKGGFNLNYLYQSSSFYNSLTLYYTKGLHMFSDFNPTDLEEIFEKYSMDYTFSKQISSIKYNLDLHLQYSKDALFSNNQISIGGPYSVRGFKEEGLSGNTGYYYRNEFSYRGKEKWFKSLTANYYLAIDGGYIKNEEDTTGGILLGNSFGVKLSHKNLSFDFSYSTALKKNDVENNKSFLAANMVYRF